jgi:hypothetical protein
MGEADGRDQRTPPGSIGLRRAPDLASAIEAQSSDTGRISRVSAKRLCRFLAVGAGILSQRRRTITRLANPCRLAGSLDR